VSPLSEINADAQFDAREIELALFDTFWFPHVPDLVRQCSVRPPYDRSPLHIKIICDMVAIMPTVHSRGLAPAYACR
jgi:hypothetical protein